MAYDPTTRVALSQDITYYFYAVEIEHPVKSIRLLDGDGFLTIDGHLFVGSDPDIGSLGSVTIDGGNGDDAPGAVIGLLPANAAIEVSLCVPEAQGAKVKVGSGAYSGISGAVLGIPVLEFAGFVDVPTLPVDNTADGVSFDCGSVHDLLFNVDEGMLLSDAFHQSVWPGELGFQYLTDVTLNMPWGAAGTRPDLTTAT